MHQSVPPTLCLAALILLLQGMLEDAAELYARLVESIAEEEGEESEAVARYLVGLPGFGGVGWGGPERGYKPCSAVW